MAAPSMEMQLVLALLKTIEAKVDSQTAKIDEIKVNMGLSATTTRDTLTKVIHDEVAASATAAKEKKKVAATGEAKAEEKKSGPAKKSHPSLPDVTEAAWNLKKTGDDYERRLDWFVSVLSKHPTHLHALIGTDEVSRINNSTEYKTILEQSKKQGDREKAKSFLAALKTIRTRENTFADISKKLVLDYDAQLLILNSQKIGQLTSETASTSESIAAAAMANLNLGTPVTIHSTTATTTTADTTATPAAQLAAV